MIKVKRIFKNLRMKKIVMHTFEHSTLDKADIDR